MKEQFLDECKERVFNTLRSDNYNLFEEVIIPKGTNISLFHEEDQRKVDIPLNRDLHLLPSQYDFKVNRKQDTRPTLFWHDLKVKENDKRKKFGFKL